MLFKGDFLPTYAKDSVQKIMFGLVKGTFQVLKMGSDHYQLINLS